jgi:hypothetical protein
MHLALSGPILGGEHEFQAALAQVRQRVPQTGLVDAASGCSPARVLRPRPA